MDNFCIVNIKLNTNLILSSFFLNFPKTPYYWPSQVPCLDSVDYAIYLAKRTLRNKQKHGLDEHEIDAFNQLRKNLSQKWDFISMQADEQVHLILHFV